MTNNNLTTSERDFFSMIAEAAFANPFSDARLEIDKKISKSDDRLTSDEIFIRLTGAVFQKIQDLKNAGKANLQLYSAKDKIIMTNVLLFEIFHKYFEKLDALIIKQLKEGDNACSIEWSDSILKNFIEYGFSETEAIHFFAIFFQLRRAHYFINSLLVGKSKCMKQLRMNLWNNIFSFNLKWYDKYLNSKMEDFSTLLIGETGTGKGSAAFAAGCSGYIPFDKTKKKFVESFTKVFISINLSQFSETLIESELFGHKKDAFTGAIDSHCGILSKTSKFGAVFLDEIGEAGIPIQIKLLKVLQERVFTPVGSHEQIRFSGRVIAATNRPLKDLIENNNRFRRDFYYRLCSDVIEIPPLRDRIKENPEELNLLTGHIIKKMICGNEAPPELFDFVGDCLNKNIDSNYPWYGNVRELEQFVRRIILKGNFEKNNLYDKNSKSDNFIGQVENGLLNADKLLAGYCSILLKKHKTISEISKILELDRRTVKKYSELIN